MKNYMVRTIEILISAAFFFLTAIADAANLDLRGTWTLEETGKGFHCPINVPGDIHTALLEAGKIEDVRLNPDAEDVNLLAVRGDWKIYRTFELDSDFLCSKALYLRLTEVDTFCDIYINGRKAGCADNRFRCHSWDVTELLHPGNNTIEGVFHSSEMESDARWRDYGQSVPRSVMGKL